jgi:hypothetical protein
MEEEEEVVEEKVETPIEEEVKKVNIFDKNLTAEELALLTPAEKCAGARNGKAAVWLIVLLSRSRPRWGGREKQTRGDQRNARDPTYFSSFGYGVLSASSQVFYTGQTRKSVPDLECPSSDKPNRKIHVEDRV